MKWCKLISATMIGTMTFVPLSVNQYQNANAQAAVISEVVVEEETSEQAQEDTMNRILVSVKKRIQIPTEYKQFSYSYENYSDTPMWYFYWITEDGNSRIMISCDNEGHILSYRKYNYNREITAPTYLKSELESKVKVFLKKAFKEYYNELSLTRVSYSGGYSNSYTYRFERKVNGILVPDNYVSISINANTGEVMSFSPNWNYDVLFQDATKILTKKEADEIIKDGLKFELEYHLTTVEDGTKMTGELVYVPSNTYLAVDAFNGELYDTRSYSYSNDFKYEEESDATADSSTNIAYDTGVLTEEEIAKIKELTGLLTKKEAIKVIKKNTSLFVDDTATNASASLYQCVIDSSKPEEKRYVWAISLENPLEVGFEEDYYYYAYTYATVDAKTGEIISFYSNTKDYNVGVDHRNDMKYTTEEGLEKAEAFLKKYYKERYEHTEYTGCSNGYRIAYIDKQSYYGGMRYTFTRMKDGIQVPNNQFYVSVDLVTGKVYEFNYDWCEKVEFESSADVITKEQAKEKYLACDGYDLVYEICAKANEEEKYTPSRLVYRTEINPCYIDAITGTQVTYYGEVMGDETIIKYTDISDSPYKREIELLCDMGIGFTGGFYQPKDAITKSELNQFMSYLYNYDLVVPEYSEDGTMTREEAAKYVIESLSLEKIAQMDIFRTIYKDDDITGSYLGYILLADQLGLVQADENQYFHAKDNFTREEAAFMLYHLISLSL